MFFLLGVIINGSRSLKLFLTLSASEPPVSRLFFKLIVQTIEAHTENNAVEPAGLTSGPAGPRSLEVNGLGRGEI